MSIYSTVAMLLHCGTLKYTKILLWITSANVDRFW